MALSNLTKVQTVGIGSNIEVVGVVTTGQFKSGTSNLHSTGVELTNLNVSGIATIGGNLSIGGTLTYEDVTNIDSIGIVTARAGVNVSGGQLDVGSNIKLGNAGVITATSFVGSGANLTSIPITSGADNRVITASSASAIQGEANLTFDGTYLNIGTTDNTPLAVGGISGALSTSARANITLKTGASDGAVDTGSGLLFFNHAGTGHFFGGSLQVLKENGTSGNTASLMRFCTRPNGGSVTEALRINSSGNLGLGESSSIDARLHVNSGTDNATLFLESTDGDVNLCMADNAGSCRLLQAGGNLRFRTGGNANAFGTGDTERMVLDSNGRLLIGTTTEGLATYGENLTIGSVGNGGMTIRTGTGNKGTVYFSDGTSGTAEYKGSIQYDHSDDSLRLAAGGSVRLRVESTGEVRMLPSTSGNTTTQFSFNNVASTPFISIKSNNLSEAAELRFDEDNGGANITFKNKNTSGQLYTNLVIKNKGSIFTTEDGSVKSYPIIMGTDTQHDAHEGQFNFHDFRAPTAQIGGWVFLGHDYGPAPYPVRRFKIAVPENAQGTRVYQVWHDGDANYDFGGLYEIRINQWANSARFESVSIRCINGNRTDLRVVAYNNTNGIMIQTSTIWGNVYIRKAGWDDNQRKRGSSYCAVENNGALAIYNASGTDDGTMPTGGSPVDVYCFDGAGGSHTGGRDIESSNNFNG